MEPPLSSTSASNINAHDSLVAPLQAIALEAPVSPARDDDDDGGEGSPDMRGDGAWRREQDETRRRSSPGWYRREEDEEVEIEDDVAAGLEGAEDVGDEAGGSVPEGVVTEWEAEGVAGWVGSLGLGGYSEAFLGEFVNEIATLSSAVDLRLLKDGQRTGSPGMSWSG
jgi:hypothetical protein